MNTMALFESGDSTGEVSLRKLFEGCNIKTEIEAMESNTMIDLCIRGGWPHLASNPAEPEIAIEKLHR